MRFDRDAAPFVAVSALPAAAALAAGHRRTAAALTALPAAVAAFFRDPNRTPDLAPASADPDLVLAPADGRVMVVGPADPADAPPGEWTQIGIFLSLADVHINRTPVGGRITSIERKPGSFLAAYRAESAHLNERTELVVSQTVDGEDRTVVFRQIVGVLARRIVTRVRAGQQLVAGQRIGLMRFGSRMDVFVPSVAEVLVTERQKVVAGETVLARWPSPAPASDQGTWYGNPRPGWVSVQSSGGDGGGEPSAEE